jgi:alanyl-tRNA synthetase
MSTQFLYLTDPLTLEFETKIQERLELPDGNLGVILSQTYFYPTGGGQEHDTGTLGEARVIDVFKSDDGETVIHVLNGEPGEGMLQATIDAERRTRHMQHHTAQHLLSGCFQQVFNLETLSSGIHGYDPTTIDLPDTELSRADLDCIEDMAQQMVYENRVVKSYFVPSEQIDTVPLRRPPKVEGDIRIVEIDGFDFSACGATHCPRTGMIGAIKILRTERINQKTRVHFVAGIQAMEYFRQYQEISTTLATELSAHPQDVIELVEKQSAQLHVAEKELRQLRLAYSAFEAQDMLVNAEIVGELKVILQTFENRPVNEIRSLGNEFKEQTNVVSMLATFDGKKMVLVATCGLETGLSAREILNRQLGMIGGRGGGDNQIAQGGGAATPEQCAAFFEHTKALLITNG